MPSAPSGLPLPLGFFVFLVLARASTGAILVFNQSTNPFTWLDCPSPPPSLAPSQSPPSNATENKDFQDNVIALLEALPYSAASAGGFASLSKGNGANQAFVRGLCRGDAIGECETSLQRAALDINLHCNGSRRAAIWYDKCFLSYADTNASTAYEEGFRQELYNIRNASDKAAFERTYYALMGHLSARAVNGSPESALAAPMFATGEALYDPGAPNGTMYGMVQCMRDRTAADCQNCLTDSISQLPSCCYGHQGGVVLAYNCYLRVEIYRYYDTALDTIPIPLSMAPSPSSFAPIIIGGKQRKKRTYVTAAVALPVGTVLVVVIFVVVFRSKRKDRQTLTRPADNSTNEEEISYVEPNQLNLSVLTAATNNFAKDNKLGERGFGEVFKGVLPDGEVVAVKRLSKHSTQGFPELKNELLLVAKLKHRNLARLMGVCLQEEKLLVYEYMPNRSLDTILFDQMKRQQLNWSKRFMIICGIARGLLYLHEESCLKVIHRDLKPSNVLLDADMNPKISDFGLARAFLRDQSRDVTIRPVGTLGYMPPEYAYLGHVSTKSDMFSFGVIVLEMVTGRRSNGMTECPSATPLLSYVWGKWRMGSVTDIVDASLGASGQYPECEVLNCIEVGLHCVQENPEDRPNASTVVLMLDSPTSSSDGARRMPSRPAFFFGCDNSSAEDAAHMLTVSVSNNEVTVSEFQPR